MARTNEYQISKTNIQKAGEGWCLSVEAIGQEVYN